MSSLTDIIFLLLIFFMLTSSFVTPNALKLVLPKATNSAMAKQTLKIHIESDNTFHVEYPDKVFEEVSRAELEPAVKNKLRDYEDYEATIVINSDENIPVKEITYVMSIGNHIRQKVILATQPE